MKNTVIYFDQALCALLSLVCCDQGLIARVCSNCYEQQQQPPQSCVCVLLTVKLVSH